MTPRLLFVVAAVLQKHSGEILLAQRPPGRSMAGLWEFPGGKLEPGETPTQALCRELAEELSVFVEPAHCRPLTFVEYPSPEFCLFMPLYHITQWQGEPRGHEGQALSWTRLHDLHSYPVPPADEALLRDLPRLLKT
jgi:8-oxo-dGTP diphosphatase